jgi:hypothetical protein
MKKMEIIIVGAIAALIAVIGISMYFSYNNQEVRLRKEIEAQNKKVEVVYDKMWKVISQKAQISSEYKESFHEIYKDIIAGRYSNGDGSLMKWITEANPEFDASIYKDLMNSIEVLRTEFQHAQERMIDLIRERETLCETMPSSMFIKNKDKIEYEVISSTQSKDVMETRMDDDVDLFKKNN